MDDLPRSNPPPPPEPTVRLILSLQRKPGDSPAGLEEEIAALINSAYPSEGRRAEPDDDAWVPADEADPSPKTVAVEARLFHAIDQIAAEDRQRVEERHRASASPPAAESAKEPVGAGDAISSHLGDLEEQIRRIKQRCRSHGFYLSAEAINVSRLATTQPSHERGGEE